MTTPSGQRIHVTVGLGAMTIPAICIIVQISVASLLLELFQLILGKPNATHLLSDVAMHVSIMFLEPRLPLLVDPSFKRQLAVVLPSFMLAQLWRYADAHELEQYV
jgi:hypothetical protein